jgi:hypothetical protein
MFEAGVFYTMIGLGLFLLMSALKFGDFFRATMQFLACTIFILIALVIFTGDDIAFVSIVSDGSNIINQTNYVSGNQNTTYNTNANWLAIVFTGLGIISGFMGFESLVNLKKS